MENFEQIVEEAVVVGMSLEQQKWIRKSMERAYNLALDKAAEETWPTQLEKDGALRSIVDKNSILKLKL